MFSNGPEKYVYPFVATDDIFSTMDYLICWYFLLELWLIHLWRSTGSLKNCLGKTLQLIRLMQLSVLQDMLCLNKRHLRSEAIVWQWDVKPRCHYDFL